MKLLKDRFNIADLKRIAKEKGGECLTSEYTGNYSSYEWACKEKHKWVSNFYNIYVGSWCRKCYDIERVKLTVGKIVIFAKLQGGKCLSPDVESEKQLLKLKCAKGHIWEIKPFVKDAKLWCPTCNKLST